MIEAWTNIPGYDGKYQIDRVAQVRRVYSSGKTRMMTPYRKKMRGSQRLVVKLTKDGKSVVKIDSSGEVIANYTSAREAARENYMSYQTVIDRCNGKCKSAYAPDGFAYAWEDEAISMKHTIRKIKQTERIMQKSSKRKARESHEKKNRQQRI